MGIVISGIIPLSLVLFHNLNHVLLARIEDFMNLLQRDNRA